MTVCKIAEAPGSARPPARRDFNLTASDILRILTLARGRWEARSVNWRACLKLSSMLPLRLMKFYRGW